MGEDGSVNEVRISEIGISHNQLKLVPSFLLFPLQDDRKGFVYTQEKLWLRGQIQSIS